MKISYLLLSLVGLFLFFRTLIKKPVSLLLTIIFSLVIIALGFSYQQLQSPSEHLLQLDDSFVFVRNITKQSNHGPHWQYIYIYGTNKTPQQVGDYFQKLVQKRSFVERLLNLLPGGSVLVDKEISQYGQGNSQLLSIQYPQGNKVSIDVNAPPIFQREMTFPTEVYMVYHLSTQNGEWIHFLELTLLFIAFGLLWFLIGSKLRKEGATLKNIFNKKNIK